VLESVGSAEHVPPTENADAAGARIGASKRANTCVGTVDTFALPGLSPRNFAGTAAGVSTLASPAAASAPSLGEPPAGEVEHPTRTNDAQAVAIETSANLFMLDQLIGITLVPTSEKSGRTPAAVGASFTSPHVDADRNLTGGRAARGEAGPAL
jgi:hypothetical protein